MQSKTLARPSAMGEKSATQLVAQRFQPLELIDKPNVDTAHAAHLLSRRPQTLRSWASLENGPIRPLRINGRLAWPVRELKRVLEVV